MGKKDIQSEEALCFSFNKIANEWFQAVYNKDIGTIEKMIKDGFNVNSHFEGGWTALHEACLYGGQQMILLLINHGADINIQNNRLRTPLHVICASFTLHTDNTKIVKLLIENGADVTTRDKYGFTPFDELKRTHPQKYEEVMQWFAEHYPEKMLEIMASESVQGKGVGL